MEADPRAGERLIDGLIALVHTPNGETGMSHAPPNLPISLIAAESGARSGSRRTERRAGKAQGIAITAVATLSVMGVVILTPVLPAMDAHYAQVPGSAALVRIALTLPALCVFLFAPLIGMLTDRINRRGMLLWSMLIYAGFGIAPLFLDSLWAIIATRVGVGVAEAVLMTASTALLGDYFDGEERERWFAAQTGVASASAVGLFLLGGVLGDFGWRMPFLAYGASLVMLVVLLILTWEPERRQERSRPTGSFPWSRTAKVYALTLFGTLVFYVVPIQLPFIINMRGVSTPSRIGLATAIASMGVLLGSAVFASRRRIPLHTLLALGLVLSGCGLMGLTFLSDYSAIVVSAALNQFGSGLYIPALLTLAMAGLPREQRGQGSGIYMACFFLGQFVSPLAVLGTSQAVGGLLPTVGALGAVCLAVGLVIAFRRDQTIAAPNGFTGR